jgi:phospholipase C
MIIRFVKLLRAALTGGATVAITALLATMSASAAEDGQSNLESIKHIIVIYQENWSFDSLYGQFPGADGYANSFDTLPQLDRTASPAPAGRQTGAKVYAV